MSERLQFVWLDVNGRAADGGPAPYLDCRPVEEKERERVAALLEEPWLKGPLEENARTLAITDLVPRHLDEVKARRLADLDRIEEAVKDRMRREITHLHHRALEIEAEERAGKRPRLNSENVRRQAESLTDRLESRLADLERQRDIAPLPPEICGAALVVPAKLLGDDASDDIPDSTPDALSRAEIEALAMETVMAYERSLGNDPSDVSSEDRGYDIESRIPETGRLRFIEVKGRRADARAITVTRNEILTALNTGDAFILAAVLVEDGLPAETSVCARSGAPLRLRAWLQ